LGGRIFLWNFGYFIGGKLILAIAVLPFLSFFLSLLLFKKQHKTKGFSGAIQLSSLIIVFCGKTP